MSSSSGTKMLKRRHIIPSRVLCWYVNTSSLSTGFHSKQGKKILLILSESWTTLVWQHWKSWPCVNIGIFIIQLVSKLLPSFPQVETRITASLVVGGSLGFVFRFFPRMASAASCNMWCISCGCFWKHFSSSWDSVTVFSGGKYRRSFASVSVGM